MGNVQSIQMPPKLKRVVESLLDGTCVPFLGAGVSAEVQLDCGGPASLSGDSLAEALAANLLKRLTHDTELQDHELLARLLPELAGTEKDGCPLQQLRESGLAKVAEASFRYYGPESAPTALCLDRWSNNPTDAHYYLAFLAREGLVEEVITTNFDCLLEEAFVTTYADSVDRDACHGLKLFVIHDIESYRKDGWRRSSSDGPSLRVVKIAGCSKKYSEAKQLFETPASTVSSEEATERARTLTLNYRSVCEQIVLTERQLQSWRGNNWSEELFRDRLRTRTVLFIGFEGEDPMIRHTAMSVMEEFSQQEPGVRREQESPPCCQYRNAPFIVVYRGVSFPQVQILSAFCLAHQCGRSAQEQGPLRLRECLETNALFPSDASLPANEFLRDLFVLTFTQLLASRYFAGNGSLARYLSPLLPNARDLVASAGKALTQKKPGFGEFAQTLWLESGRLSEASAAHLAALDASYGSNSQSLPRGAYVALLDQPVALPLLYFLWLIVQTASAQDDLANDSMEAFASSEVEKDWPAAGSLGARIGVWPLMKPKPGIAQFPVYCTFGDPQLGYGNAQLSVLSHERRILIISLHGTKTEVWRPSLRAGVADRPGRCMSPEIVVVPDKILLRVLRERSAGDGIPDLLAAAREVLLEAEQFVAKAESWRSWCHRR